MQISKAQKGKHSTLVNAEIKKCKLKRRSEQYEDQNLRRENAVHDYY
jgi:hypothetical protein